ALAGGLHLEGPATFANMVITPGAVDGLSPDPSRDPKNEDSGLVRNWRLSAVSTLPSGKTPAYSEMPGNSQEWKAISTERRGLVNLTREYGLPVHQPDQGLAWLKTILTSDKKQTKKVDIGWTREIWVFVNGKLVYSGKNLWDQEAERKAPDGRCSLENGSFPLPLEPGDNEVAVAIANNFYGWGLMLRLADPEGGSLAAKGQPMVDKQWMKSRPGQVVLAALGWTILGCVFALPDLSAGAGARHALLSSLSIWWSWGIITPLIVWVDRLIPVSRRQLARRVLAHFLPSLLLTSVYAYLLGTIRATFGLIGWNGLASLSFLLNAFKGMFLWNWLNYWLILGAW